MQLPANFHFFHLLNQNELFSHIPSVYILISTLFYPLSVVMSYSEI